MIDSWALVAIVLGGNSGTFWFILVQWEEVEKHSPALFMPKC